MASSSSTQPETVKNDILMDKNKSGAPPKVYDVFINHRGPDVKETLAYDLYNYLQERGCCAFLDSEKIDMGDSISSTIRDAIRSSSVQIAIFSKRYAESPWCLAELNLMLEAEAEFNAKFIPVFYGVEPWELRHVKKRKGVYAEAFSTHERQGRYPNNLDMWKSALEKASDFSGYELKTNSQYHPMCSKIVSVAQREVERRKPLHVSKYTVGLDELVADFESQCGQKSEKNNVVIAGIFGMGGSGKTTLAKELFNGKRSNYSGSCFVGDVRESSRKGELASLQTKIIKDLFNEAHPGFQNISEGIAHLRNRLESGTNSRYLIVLDDIDDEDQIDSLLCIDALGSHSSVFITTRDKSVLERAGITVHYNLKEMEDSKATELFFIGKPKSTAIRIWKGSRLSAELAVESLRDKCLVEVGYEVGYAYGELLLRMHDHLRDMGREIADELSHPRRLWNIEFLTSLESKGFEKILTETNDRCFHSFIDHSIGSKVTYFVGEPNADRSTVLLWLELKFKEGTQLESIPSWIPLRRLQCLKIVDGYLTRLWQEDGSCSSQIPQPSSKCSTSILKRSNESKYRSDAEVPVELKELLLEKTILEEFPSTLGKLIYLENLHLKGRFSYISNTPRNSMLVEGRSFSESLRKLSNLRSLILWNFFLRGELDLSNGKDVNNSGFSSARGMSHLQTIHIRFVKLISKISICGENCPRLVSLRLDSMEDLAVLHLRKLTTLNYLHIRFCKKLKTLSGNFDRGKLQTVSIKECGELEEVPNLSCLTSLERITIDQCPKLRGINGIEDLEGLQYLYLSTGDGGGGVWNCIQRLKRFPSESSILIGRAVDGAESKLNASFFSGLVSPDAVTELYPRSKERESKASVKMPNSLSAIIICALVESSSGGEIKTPITIHRSLTPGERIVTIVLTGQKEVYRRHSPDLTLSLFHAELKKKFVVTVNGEEESKGLKIFNKIISLLYKGIP